MSSLETSAFRVSRADTDHPAVVAVAGELDLETAPEVWDVLAAKFTTVTPWESLSGVTSSSPDASAGTANNLDMFTRGSDYQLWHRRWNGTTWSAYESLGGYLTSSPSAVSWGPNRIDVFGRGTDNGLWHLSWNGSTWSAWQALGGVLTSGPDASSCASGHLDVFATGNGNGLFQMGFNGSGWTGWMGVPGTGGPWTSDPAAECRPGVSSASLFARGTDNALWTVSVPGS